VSAKLVCELKLGKDDERALIRACWIKLPKPSELPRAPEFWYGDPPRADPRSSWDVGKHQKD
jgi:hypothetical protein